MINCLVEVGSEPSVTPTTLPLLPLLDHRRLDQCDRQPEIDTSLHPLSCTNLHSYSRVPRVIPRNALLMNTLQCSCSVVVIEGDSSFSTSDTTLSCNPSA